MLSGRLAPILFALALALCGAPTSAYAETLPLPPGLTDFTFGMTALSRELGVRGTKSLWFRSTSRGGRRSPILERLVSERAKRATGNEMSLDVECVVDGAMNGQEALR